MSNNLSSYKIFCAVANQGNISSAAKELFISQPAVSKAISKLEQNLNVILFERTSRGVTLTYEGRLLYTQVEGAFHAIRQGEDQIKELPHWELVICLLALVQLYVNTYCSLICRNSYRLIHI